MPKKGSLRTTPETYIANELNLKKMNNNIKIYRKD